LPFSQKVGYRYYQASEQIALLSERTSQLSAELEGVAEVHKLTEAKSAKEVRQAEGDVAKLTGTKEKLRAEVRGLRKKVAKAGEENPEIAGEPGGPPGRKGKTP
jgi:chromosome segregation ATPase